MVTAVPTVCIARQCLLIPGRSSPRACPPPVTPALPAPPRDPIALGGTGAIWNLGGKLDTLRSQTREEDDLMEPDSPLEGFHSLVVERFEVCSFYLRTSD